MNLYERQLEACQLLVRVMQGMPLEAATAQATSALVKDWLYGVFRFSGTLQFFLRRMLQQRPPAEVEALLLVALYDIHFRQAPDYRVTSQAVDAAPGPFRALVNGTLRRFLREREQLAQEALETLEARYNHPLWWLRKLKLAYPNQWEDIIAVGNSHAPMVLRVDVMSAEAYVRLLAQKKIVAMTLGPCGVELDSPLAVDKLPGFEQGIVSVQDASAQWGALLLAPSSGMRVLDACAAPGGKTCHIKALAPDIDLVALDEDPARLRKVSDNLERCGHQALLISGDARQRDWWNGQLFDCILLDAPCSASGVVARHPDIKWQRDLTEVMHAQARQKQLLDNLLPLCRQRLVYATCSVFAEENEQVVAWALAHFPQWRVCPPQGQFAQWLEANSQHAVISEHGVQILPSAHWDGFFYAVLEKQ